MAESSMEALWRSGHISGGNASYVETMFEDFLEDPEQCPEQWRRYFESLSNAAESPAGDLSHATVKDHFLLLAKNQSRVVPASASSVSSNHERKQFAVGELINGYRRRGHLKAKLDPLGLAAVEAVPSLTLEHHGLSDADRDTWFQVGSLALGKPEASLSEIVAALEETYCGSIGAEYMHISDQVELNWVQDRMEGTRAQPYYGHGTKRRLLDRILAAEGLELYLGKKYPGTKRFGLEGAETFICCLAELIHRAGASGVVESVIGMAHRGRLNVLVNLLGKDPATLFDEFEGRYEQTEGSGDVKYHQGFSSNLMTPGGEMHLALGFNPSHLEIAAPVIAGSVRARMDRRQDSEGDKVLAINVHGDAAFAGQGVVMETFQMSQTRGFYSGGTIHVIINNQIGYTISKQEDARSTHYCTEVAKMVQAPIFHVNGDDPLAVLFVSQMALDYRMAFKKDVVIDIVCYRRRGHNEGDEPAITQPKMYQAIRQHPTVLSQFSQQLIKEGAIDLAEYERRVIAYRDALDEGKAVAWDYLKEPDTSLFVDWTPHLGKDWDVDCDTRFDHDRFQTLARQMLEISAEVDSHRQVKKILEERQAMAEGRSDCNWGFAEMMAYATLLEEGFNVRLTGQDVGRGTFAHRHAVLHDQGSGTALTPIAQLPTEGTFQLYDSLLSEEAVLAFEYGYSQTSPKTLVIWEAQFGDFANGAQVVIDQFITSGEHKWARLSGLTMLLPHGYEGAGPEHSSARLERYLQLSAEHNIQVCVPTTPAQIYHLLRRQMIRATRKPLIILSPKSLLRLPEAVSPLTELTEGRFETVLMDDSALLNPDAVKRLVICSGKVYYDLLRQRDQEQLNHVAILRVEQLYPFPQEALGAALSHFTSVEEAVWCQEEPMNQGAWYSSQHHIRRALHRVSTELNLTYAGREPSAAAAAGTMGIHQAQQETLVTLALKGGSSDFETIQSRS
jgi:2-oxoglutarate dehydrogenase E1 component